ncbi:MAG: CRISPR-associated endonuclease Cas2 [Isosphaeraceae bacterium]
MKWVIAYDVRRDKARRKVARRLEQVGFRRQKSVFEGEASPVDVRNLLDELAELIQPDHDVLTAWPMTENGPASIQHRGSPRAIVRRDWLIL